MSTRIDAGLETALETVGWFELYSEWMPDLSQPNNAGECNGCSPFPHVSDTHPSFAVNINTGLWYCHQTRVGGNYVQFRAFIDAKHFDDRGEPITDYKETEIQLKQEFGVAAPITAEWLQAAHQTLISNSELILQILDKKPWLPATISALGIGYDLESSRYVFPILDSEARPINARLYNPNAKPKSRWKVSNLSSNFLWPQIAYQDKDYYILVEGEPDATSLRSYGFNGITGTMGASNPVPGGGWYRNKDVYICMDVDTVGQKAEERCIFSLNGLAKRLFVIRLPEWDGRPENADISDYIKRLRSLDVSPQDIQNAISDLLRQAVKIEQEHDKYDMDAVAVPFSSALSGENVGHRIEFPVRISARSENRHLLPKRFRLSCPARGQRECSLCPMRVDFNGTAEINHDPRSRLTLSMIQVNDEQQFKAVKQHLGLPVKCPSVTMSVLETIDIEATIVTSSLLEGAEDEVDTTAERNRREAYVILGHGFKVEENRDYLYSGFVHPDPKTQAGVFLIDSAKPVEKSTDHFKLSDSEREALKAFRPHGESKDAILDCLFSAVDDLSNSTTLIRGRADLHLAYRTVWHCATRFMLSGVPIERGWIDCMVIGDTRCGKSATFRRMRAFYGVGELIDSKMQTPAGLLGSVVTSPQTGERYILPGVLARQDKAGPCLIDEFQSTRWGHQSIMDVASSVRSEGIIKITKAANGEFYARTPLIWSANPGRGKLMADLSYKGCELIAKLIAQPEDIARFDFALAVSQDEVPVDVINDIIEPAEPIMPRDLAVALQRWARSRRSDQIIFSADAVTEVKKVAADMVKRYDATIPLVEPADQKSRVAKVAVSVAAQCYSSDDAGECLLVGPEHVQAAYELFKLWYDKPAMDYLGYSQSIAERRAIRSIEAVLTVFNEVVSPHGKIVAGQLLENDEFSERAFLAFVPSQGVAARSALLTLIANNCLRLVRSGVRDTYEKTPLFVNWLKEYVAHEMG